MLYILVTNNYPYCIDLENEKNLFERLYKKI